MALRRTVRDISLIANDPDSADWLPGVPVRADDREERGGLVGMHTAIRHVRGDVLVVAWDMPFVSADLLRLIVETGSGVAGAVVPEGPRGLEPMCALYSPACLPAIDRALDDGELRLSSVVARLPALVRVPIERVRALGDPERLFFNVNTPRDLELAEVLARSE
jgi:molybdopterin-guanine dinucleotide biosynthesis protein A